MYLINNILEQAIETQMALFLGDYPSININVSDELDDKTNEPSLLIHVDQAEEQIVPGSGIFKCATTLTFKSHPKGDASGATPRDTIVQIIQGFAYSTPIPRLNNASLYVHGFVPVSEVMTVDAGGRAYSYETRWDIYCMPRANS